MNQTLVSFEIISYHRIAIRFPVLCSKALIATLLVVFCVFSSDLHNEQPASSIKEQANCSQGKVNPFIYHMTSEHILDHIFQRDVAKCICITFIKVYIKQKAISVSIAHRFAKEHCFQGFQASSGALLLRATCE
jgi:hypothetical protein